MDLSVVNFTVLAYMFRDNFVSAFHIRSPIMYHSTK